MGKGLLPDTHPLCISAARSAALARADVVLVVGARLNWILHYGHQPKWAQNVKFIRIEIEHEAVDDNVKAAVGLVGDARAVIEQLNSELASRGYRDTVDVTRSKDSQDSDIKLSNADHAAWYQSLLAKCHDNSQKMIQKSVIFPKIPSLKPYDPPKPLQYHQAFALIKRHIPEDHIFIGEGANTLDIARSMFDVYQPRSRLDPGTQATMGVGMGLTIAAGVLAQQEVESGQRRNRRKVVAIVGDSAFGFSAMEVETAVRNRLGMLIIVMNNGGVSKDSVDHVRGSCLFTGLQGSFGGAVRQGAHDIFASDCPLARSQIRATGDIVWWTWRSGTNTRRAHSRSEEWVGTSRCWGSDDCKFTHGAGRRQEVSIARLREAVC